MNLLGTEFLRETQKRGHERSKWKLAYRYHKPPGAWPQKIGQSVRLLGKLLKNWTLHHCEKTKKINDQIFDTDLWFDTEFFDFTHLYLSLSRVKSCTSMVFSLWFIGSKISLMPSFVKLMTKSTFNGSWNKQVQTCST